MDIKATSKSEVTLVIKLTVPEANDLLTASKNSLNELPANYNSTAKDFCKNLKDALDNVLPT